MGYITVRNRLPHGIMLRSMEIHSSPSTFRRAGTMAAEIPNIQTHVHVRSRQNSSRMPHMAESNRTRISLCDAVPTRSLGVACASAPSYTPTSWRRGHLCHRDTRGIPLDFSHDDREESGRLVADSAASFDCRHRKLQLLQSAHCCFVFCMYDGRRQG